MHGRCATKNLGPRARRAQLQIGVVWLGVALAGGLAMVELGASAVFGWLLLLPLAFGTYGMLAGLFGICAFAGARGGRLADYGYEAVADCSLRQHLRVRGAGVALFSLAWAVAATALFVASV